MSSIRELEARIRELAGEFLRDQRQQGAPRSEAMSAATFAAARAVAAAGVDQYGEDHALRAAHLSTNGSPRLVPEVTARFTAGGGLG